jgi:hypothetical protein
MNAAQALKIIRKLYGAKATYSYNERAPKADEREELRAQLPALVAARDAARAARDKRRLELLSDPEYARLRKLADEADTAHSRVLSVSLARRVTVGVMGGVPGLPMFEVKASGDNFQDAIDNARKAVQP